MVQLLAGLDLLGHQFHGEAAASADGVGQLGRRQRQDVELDYRDQVEQRVVVLPDVVVKGQPIAALGQLAAPRYYLGVSPYALEDFDHRL